MSFNPGYGGYGLGGYGGYGLGYGGYSLGRVGYGGYGGHLWKREAEPQRYGGEFKFRYHVRDLQKGAPDVVLIWYSHRIVYLMTFEAPIQNNVRCSLLRAVIIYQFGYFKICHTLGHSKDSCVDSVMLSDGHCTVWIGWISHWNCNNGRMGCTGPFGPFFHFRCDIPRIHSII